MDDNPYLKERLATIDWFRSKGMSAYPNGLRLSHTLGAIKEKYDSQGKEDLEKVSDIFSVAGRIIAIRAFGKAAFLKLRDRTGELQVFVQNGTLSQENFDIYKHLDVGDFVHAEGGVFKTKTNELTIQAVKLGLVTKSIRPLPEKWHGLTDVETRYRQRYVDLIASESVRDVFIKRSKIIQWVREFFTSRDYLEVETPMMHPIPGGATARPFITHHNTLGMDLYLRVAPELFLKRLVVGGLERVFEINRNFRNEGISTQHNPEFTMIEFYQAYATYEDLIILTEELIEGLAARLCGSTEITYQGEKISFKRPFARYTFMEALEKLGGVDPKLFSDEKAARKLAEKEKIELKGNEGLGKLWMEVFEKRVEKKLIQPTYITKYPTEISPLSRKNDADPTFVDRFELYVAGREIANAFSELNDPFDQKERFLLQVEEKKKGDEEAMGYDDDYIRALEYGMPPTAGEGIGIDRLVMILTDQPSIRDVILFPLLRPEK